MPQLQNGQGREITIPPGQSIAISTVTGTYTAEVLDGAAKGVIASGSDGGGTFGPYVNGATVKVTAGSSALVTYDVGLTPSAQGSLVPSYATDASGNVTGLVGPDGSTIALGSTATSLNGKIYAYNEDGTVTTRKMPRKDRIQKYGSIWFTPTALTGTAARNVDLYTGNAFVTQSPADASKPVVISYLTGGYTSASWTGLSLQTPSDGLLQALVYLDDYENGAASPLGGGIDIQLTTASGSTVWKFSSSGLKPGWNTLQLWNPATDAHNVCFKTGVSYLGTTAMTFGQTVIGVALIANNAAASSRVILAGIFTQTKVKPMVCMTFDTSAADIFTNFVPAWKAKGLTAGLRSGGADSYRSATWDDRLAAAMTDGFDVYNGSWSRLNLTQSTTAVQLAREVGLQQNYQAERGFTRGACLFSSAGNALPKASVYRDVMPKFGVTMAKGGTGGGRANFFGPAGLDDPLYLTVQGWGGRTAELGRINGLLQTGGLLMWFGHECPYAGSEPPPDTASPGNGGGMYAEDAVYFANYLADLKAQGLIDVVSPSQLDLILNGLA